LASGFFFAVPLLFSQTPQAVIQNFVGTVEVRQPGSQAWQPAVIGQTLSADTVISTGFRSTARISLGGSVVTVQPLTRLSLAELARNQNDERIEVTLTTGRVRAEVRPAAGASRTEFTIRGPSATASVRGTVFEFDTVNLSVTEGTVAFSGTTQIPVLIDAGGVSFADMVTGRTASQQDTFMAELRPSLPIASEVTTVATPEAPTTGMTFNIRWPFDPEH